MVGRLAASMAAVAVLISPAFAVESVYLDSVPITYPGEYLAPANFYLQVPPPEASFNTAVSLAPATIYNYGVSETQSTATLYVGTSGYAGFGDGLDSDAEAAGRKLRVHIAAGLDHASDVPLAVIREHFAESENVELVEEGDVYDVLVEIETMKLDSSPIVILVINAYKFVEDERLIFYNNFGYLGELKLLSGSAGYAVNLQSALEAEVLQQEEK